MRTNRVFLIGMMGAGKSTVGSRVAHELGWRFLDSDEEIVRSTGSSVPEIWRSRGEPAFRAEEARVLAEAATSEEPVVVAVAGGAVLDPENRRRIRGAGTVIWLRASVDILAARVGEGEGRPLLDNDPLENMRLLYSERRDLYEGMCDVVIDVEGALPEDIASRIVALVSTPQRRQHA